MSEVPVSVGAMTGTGSLPLELDASQRAAVAAILGRGSTAVLGAPGTGKTTLLVELVAELIGSGAARADEVLVLGADRRSSARLRDRLAARLEGATSGGTLGRSPQSAAFEILRGELADGLAPAPRLLTGADEDALLAETLAGELEDGTARWPEPVTAEMLELRGFRAELRELLAVAAEHDLDPARLRELAAAEGGLPVWAAAGDFLERMQDDEALAGRGGLTPSRLVLDAVSALLGRAGEAPAGRPFEAVRWVLADDAQELTESSRALLDAFERLGASVVTFGDPDTATGGFRGARPEHAVSWREPGDAPPPAAVLALAHRHGAELREAVAALVARIGVRHAVEHRRAAGGRGAGPSVAADAAARGAVAGWQAPRPIEWITAPNPVAEAEAIASYLRELHLAAGVPWGQLAVVVRSSGAIRPLARLLGRFEIPTAADRPATAADDPSVAAIVRLAGIAAGLEPLDEDALVAISCSPLFGADRTDLRPVRKALRFEERLGGGDRPSGELLVEAVSVAAGLITLDDPERGAAASLGLLRQASSMRYSRGVRALDLLGRSLRAARARFREGGAVDEVMWEIWASSGRATGWREQALGAGPAADRANERLDAVVALFDAAKRFVEKSPDDAPAAFLEPWSRREIPVDSLARHVELDAVKLGTPAALVGREFRAVVVAGLNDGAWPNLRLRDTILGAGRLVDLVRGQDGAASVADRRREVLHDELRLLAQAVSRAGEHVLLTAIEGEDEQPSRVLEWLPRPATPWAAGFTEGASSLRRAVGTLRRAAVGADAPKSGAGAATSPRGLVARIGAGPDPGRDLDPAEAAVALARLAAAGAPGADPASWLGLRGRSTMELVRFANHADEHEAEHVLAVSPSAVESYEKCPVNWFVERHGGGEQGTAMGLGVIVHAAAEFDFPDAQARLDHILGRLEELPVDASWERLALEARAERIAGRLEGYLALAEQQGREVIGLERPFTMPLPADAADDPLEARVRWPLGEGSLPVVRGKIDRIERQGDGTLRVIDFKTGAASVSEEQAKKHGQLGAYRLAIHRDAVRPPDPEPVRDPVDGAAPPAPSLDPGGPIPAGSVVDAADLVYLGGDTVKATVRCQSSGDQPLEEVRRRLVDAAHGMAGVDVERLAALADESGSFAEVPADELEAAIRRATAAAILRFHPESHCDKGFGGQPACAIHRIPEVTE